MFDTNPYLKMFGITAAVIFGTLFNLSVVIFEEPPACFGWFFGMLSGASWGIWFILFNSFLERDKDFTRRTTLD